MSIKTDSLYIDNFPALHAGLVGNENWKVPASGRWVPSITGEGATGAWNIDISGMAEYVKINPSGADNLSSGDIKQYLVFASGDGYLSTSDSIYVSGSSVMPFLEGIIANPRMKPLSLNEGMDYYLLWGGNPRDGHSAFYHDTMSLASYKELGVTKMALRVPNLVIGNNPPNASNLLTKKQISIAGCSIPIWGGSVSAATLRNKLNLSSALRFVGQTASSIDDGGTQYPIINGEVYTPLLGDVIIQSSTGYEYLWTGSAWERLGPDGSYKIVQDEYTSVNEPIQGSSGNFISNITQDSNGNISVEKKTLESLNLIYPTGQKKVYSGSNLDFSLSLIDNSSSSNYWPLLYGMNYRSDATGTSFDSVVNDKFGIAQYANKIYIQPSTGSLYTNNFYALNKFVTKIENYTTSELVSRTTSNTNEDGTTTNLYNGELRLYGNNNKYTVLRPGNPTNSIALNLPITGQTLIGTAGSNALAGNFIPATNNKIDLGASDKKWQNIYATTFNGNLVGISDEAKKVSNSLTINNRGKEITFNGEKSATLIVNRRCSVGRHGDASKSSFYTEDGKLKGWQKVASIIFKPHHTDREIVFKVSKGISAHEYSGILRAHLRINDTAATASKLITQLIWEYANAGVDPNKLMLIGTADTANNKIIGELWMNIGTASYDIYHFDVLQEHDRSVAGDVGYSDLWTLYNHNGSKEEDWQYFDLNEMSNKTLSTLAIIKNNAETATSLQNLTASITELNYMSGVTDNIQEQLNSLLPLAGGVVTGITTFGDNIIKTMNGGQPGGQWTNTNSRSQLIIGSKGASEGEITLYHANGNSVTLKTEAYQSIAAIDLTLPSHHSQTLIGTAGSRELVGHLTPALNAEINLGSTFSPWNTIYAKNIIFGNSNHIYGTEDQRLALSPSLGQIFFQLIDE